MNKIHFDFTQPMIFQITEVNIPIQIRIFKRNQTDIWETGTTFFAENTDDRMILSENVAVGADEITAGWDQYGLGLNLGGFALKQMIRLKLRSGTMNGLLIQI